MLIEQLEVWACAQLPMDAPAGARGVAHAEHGGLAIEVVCRVDRRGRRVFRYVANGKRMARSTLAMLMCPETACPRAQAVQCAWQAFSGGRPEASWRTAQRAATLRPRPLMDEVSVQVAGHDCSARPATFNCLTPCPMGAHPPEHMRKDGWDLFEAGHCLAGGVVTDAATGATVPRFGSLSQARGWLLARQGEAQHMLTRLR